MSNITANGTNSVNGTISAPGEPAQVHGQTAFWAILAVALNAMAQTSILTDIHMETEGMFGGGLYPQMSSPILCGVDAIMELALLLPLIYRRLTARIGWTSAPRSTATITTGDGDPMVVSNIRQLVSVRVVLFVFAVLPQAIKVYSMTGVPALQIVTTLFLAAPIVRIISTMYGRDFEDQKKRQNQRHLANRRGRRGGDETTEQATSETMHLEDPPRGMSGRAWAPLLWSCNVLAHAYAYQWIWYEAARRIDLSGTVVHSFMRSNFFYYVDVVSFSLVVAWATGILFNGILPASIRGSLRWSPVMTVMLPMRWIENVLLMSTGDDGYRQINPTRKHSFLAYVYTVTPLLFVAFFFSLGVATSLDKLVGLLSAAPESEDAIELPPMLPGPIATEIDLGAHTPQNHTGLVPAKIENAAMSNASMMAEGNYMISSTRNEATIDIETKYTESSATEQPSGRHTHNIHLRASTKETTPQIIIRPWPVSKFLDNSRWLYEVRPVRKMIQCGIFNLTIPPKTIPHLITFWLERKNSDKPETGFSSGMMLTMCLSVSNTFRSFRSLVLPALAAAWDGGSIRGLQDRNIVPSALVRALEPIAGCPLEQQQQQQQHDSMRPVAGRHLHADNSDSHDEQMPRQDTSLKVYIVVHSDAVETLEAISSQSNNLDPGSLPPQPSSESTRGEGLAQCKNAPHSIHDHPRDLACDALEREHNAEDPETRGSRSDTLRSVSPASIQSAANVQSHAMEPPACQDENGPSASGSSQLPKVAGDAVPDWQMQIKAPAESFLLNMDKSLDYLTLINTIENTTMYVVHPRGYFDPRVERPGHGKHDASNQIALDEEAQTIKRDSVPARLGQVLFVLVGASLLFLAQLLVLSVTIAMSAFFAHGVVRLGRPVWNKIEAGMGGRRAWAVFAIFNLCTTVVYCAVVFDGTDTTCPSWTDLFG